MKTPEFSRRSKLSPTTVRTYIREGKIKATLKKLEPGNVYYDIPEEEVERFLKGVK